MLQKTSSTPRDSCQKLAFILRRRMIKLYRVALKHALQYAAAVLEITLDLKTPANAEAKTFWDDAQEALLSGILVSAGRPCKIFALICVLQDFLEQHSTSYNPK